MTERDSIHGLQVATSVRQFIENEALPGTEIAADAFWAGLATMIRELAPKNRALLAERDRLQTALDDWCRAHSGPVNDMAAYRDFLQALGYLRPQPTSVVVGTSNVAPELSHQAGPQLVVPVTNARYALNAANARWGSLYDALYGTDAIAETGGAERGRAYNPVRGKRVVACGRRFLDDTVPLAQGSHADAVRYTLQDGQLVATLAGGSHSGLADPAALVGWRGSAEAPHALLFCHHGLHVEVQIDAADAIGQDDAAHVKDIVLEAAVTTIVDFEDSVSVVDAADKVAAWRNWLGLMRGDLEAEVSKAGETFTRRLAPDRHYNTPNGKGMTRSGRSLLLVRNVGHAMMSDVVLDEAGRPVPEGILDAVVSTLLAMHDATGRVNPKSGSCYIVKPKMHGPDEVAFACELFARTEDLLGLPRHSIKMGIMDEERRTSLNLKACIAAAAERVVFINTGFLDRTGDEIRSSTHAGAMVRKGAMKAEAWIAAYEKNNVQVGLACGLRGRAQIGKGMWAKPAEMAAMLTQKGAQLEAGANTAWVPSPTAATLHAMHYHQVDVDAVQAGLEGRHEDCLDGLLTVPVVAEPEWSAEAIREELDNNCQGILGYVVRWVEQGVGCSTVPNIHDVGLMEDRATLRISSQHIANWLLHGVVTPAQVDETLARMAVVVDGQNAGDPAYRPMAARLDKSCAFQAARDLIFKGLEQPNGYTEPLLHGWRRRYKARRAG